MILEDARKGSRRQRMKGSGSQILGLGEIEEEDSDSVDNSEGSLEEGLDEADRLSVVSTAVGSRHGQESDGGLLRPEHEAPSTGVNKSGVKARVDLWEREKGEDLIESFEKPPRIRTRSKEPTPGAIRFSNRGFFSTAGAWPPSPPPLPPRPRSPHRSGRRRVSSSASTTWYTLPGTPLRTSRHKALNPSASDKSAPAPAAEQVEAYEPFKHAAGKKTAE